MGKKRGGHAERIIAEHRRLGLIPDEISSEVERLEIEGQYFEALSLILKTKEKKGDD